MKNPPINELIGRRFDLDIEIDRATDVDEENRTVELSISSDKPIQHWFGRMILDHGPQSIRLDRMRAGAPLLLNHNPSQQIGVLQNVRVEDGKLRATARFSRSTLAQEIFQDIADGIRRNTSVGFVLHELDLEQKSDKGPNTYRSRDWEPLEGSIASVPRDISVGVGRAMTNGDEPKAVEPPNVTETENESRTEPTLEQEAPAVIAPATPATVITRSNTMDPNEITGATNRVTEFVNFAQMFGTTESHRAELTTLAREIALSDKDFPALRTAVLERLKQWETNVEPSMPVDLNEKERQQYSISRAILTDAERRMGRNVNCFELEVSQEIEKKLDAPGYRRANGFLMPTGMPLGPGAIKTAKYLQRAGLDTATSTKGSELVFIEPGGFIDMLRTRARVIQLGAMVLPGLQGNIAFPRQTGAGTFSWVGENPGSDVATSELALDQVQMSPHTGMSHTQYSRQLLRQGVVNVDNIVQNDLVQINARGIDRASLHGTGLNNQPKGLYAISGVNSEAFGGPITYDHVVNMETKIAAVDADVATMAYLFTPEVKGKAKKTPQLENTIALPIWYQNEINGYRAESTNQLSKTLGSGSDHGGIFGAWEFLYIGEWGALEILTDPYTLAAQGMIRVITFVMVDVAARYEQAFTKATTLTVN